MRQFPYSLTMDMASRFPNQAKKDLYELQSKLS